MEVVDCRGDPSPDKERQLLGMVASGDEDNQRTSLPSAPAVLLRIVDEAGDDFKPGGDRPVCLGLGIDSARNGCRSNLDVAPNRMKVLRRPRLIKIKYH